MVTDTQPQVPISLALAQTALLLLCLRSFLSLAINTGVCRERRYRSANLVLLHQWPSHLKIAGALFHLQKTPISWETQLLPSKAVLYLIIWTKTSILKKKKASRVSERSTNQMKEGKNMQHFKITIFKEIIRFGASVNNFCMLEFNTVTVTKVESKKSTKNKQAHWCRPLAFTKCAFATGRQVSSHTFSGCKLQPPYVKLHDPMSVRSRTYMYIFEAEKETAAKENVAFNG